MRCATVDIQAGQSSNKLVRFTLNEGISIAATYPPLEKRQTVGIPAVYA
jgi:hypothetical protein